MSGYYSEINAPCDAIYEVACAMDNQDVPLEDWPRKIIDALSKAGYAVVPTAIPDSSLGEAAMMLDATGNPKHLWDFLLANTRA
ncbi:hypothetical protein [Candidatus Macondimonas diazotrophica]|uniref:Uncharacterized protein n=1 Tax=Candidatus Macondimonas diazotrophica TaxID=2305248 RepID=A0A4Z0F7Q6_9GAMM|nr:hypothetical protein [Candidatus Macondimonas diazotrophica]TFZ81246.1 hypothetical protein E4680_13275 [Candidatus Macondimonas diazotrophica]